MDARKKISLPGGSVLRLYSMDGTGMQTFSALAEVGAGAGSVCYAAIGARAHHGLLKEYCPADLPLERDEHGVLRPAPGHEDAFFRGRAAFFSQYRRMQRLAAEHPEMHSFLPVLELFENEKDDGTIYVWDPHPPQTTFARICDATRACCLRSPERQVYRNLSAVRSLVQCLQHLHRAGYAHGDIKPDNFGFSERAGELLTQAVSLFDLDTVRPLTDPACGARGTHGYMDPAAGTDGAAADLYAVGCVLFRALIVSPDLENDVVYEPRMFSRLEELAESSLLLAGIPGDAGALLRAKTVQLLRRCLCPPASRYVCCEDLLTDIDRALYYAEPLVRTAQERTEICRWQLQKKGSAKTLPEDGRIGVALAYWLFCHPLRPSRNANGERQLQILVCGLDQSAQIYLDTVLQLAQVVADDVSITVVGAAPEEIREYLQARPSLHDFFAIDERCPGTARYGSIRFVRADLLAEAPETWPEELQKAARGASAVLVSLGSEVRSVRAARAITEISSGDVRQGRVGFIRRGQGGRALSGPVAAVDMGEVSEEDPIFADMERMAFNVQLVWEPNLQTDFAAIEERFRKPYNYAASIMGAVAAKYRTLADDSLGPDTDAARRRSMWREHKRWVTEKICAGWTPPEDLRACAAGGGTAKLAHLRQHACIVPSRPDSLLKDRVQTHGAAFWDTASDADIAQLDPLDAMSVRLHQLLRRRAGDPSNSQMAAGRLMSLLEDLSSRDPAVRSAFLAWRQALESAQTDTLRDAEICEKRRSAFLAAAARLPEQDAQRARRLAEELTTELAPVLASVRRADYKEIDRKIVDATPFILSYSTNAALLAPLQTGANEVRLENVRCAAAMNPAKLVYTYVLTDADDTDELVHTLEGTQAFLRSCNMRAKVQMHIFAAAQISDEYISRLQKRADRVWPTTVHRTAGVDDVRTVLEQIAQEAAAETDIAAVQLQDTSLGRLLLKSCSQLPVCSVSFGKVLLAARAADAPPAVLPGPDRIDVSDLLALRSAPAPKGSLPDFANICDTLWNEYSLDRAAWRRLCRTLQAAADDNDVVCDFHQNLPVNEKNRTYYLSSSCRREAETAAEGLLQHGVIGGYRCRSVPYAELVQLELEDCRGEDTAYNRLFGDTVWSLTAPVQICARGSIVQARADRLAVRDLSLEGGWNGNTAALLSRFEQHGIVQELQICGTRADFRHASFACKRLLTDTALILELRTAALLQEMRELDDLLCSADIRLPQDGLFVERVFAAVRGYRCVFLRCAQPEDVSPGMVHRIGALRDTAGVGAAAVVVTDGTTRLREDVRREAERDGVLLTDADGVQDIVRHWLVQYGPIA